MRSAVVRCVLAFIGSFALAASAAACLGAAHSGRTYSVSVVPQLPPAATYARWAPLLERVGRQAGACFDLTIPETIAAFEKSLWSGRPDFAFANPYHEVIAKRRQGYVPLLVDTKTPLSGIIVVRADSPIRDIRELHGKDLSFPSPNAFAASLLIRSELARQGIRINPVYLKTHANVYRSVVAGDKPAGGGVNNTLQREEEGLRQSLRVLYETPKYAPHPLAAHPRVPRKAREDVIAAFLALADDAQGRALLEAVQMPQPGRADYPRDFLPLERLGLERFVVLNED